MKALRKRRRPLYPINEGRFSPGGHYVPPVYTPEDQAEIERRKAEDVLSLARKLGSWWFRLSRWFRAKYRYPDSRQCPECGVYIPHMKMYGTADDARQHRWRMPSDTSIREATR